MFISFFLSLKFLSFVSVFHLFLIFSVMVSLASAMSCEYVEIMQAIHFAFGLVSFMTYQLLKRILPNIDTEDEDEGDFQLRSRMKYNIAYAFCLLVHIILYVAGKYQCV